MSPKKAKILEKSLLLRHDSDWLKATPDDVLGLLDEALNKYWKSLAEDHPLRERFAGLGCGIQQEIERRINKRRRDTALK